MIQKHRKFLALFLLAMVCLASSAATQVLINEYLSSNIDGILDEDGDSSDWIELYNLGPTDVDLEGYSLSDDEDEPFKWVFLSLGLAAGEHMHLFASGKDRKLGSVHWETVIDWGDPWRYRVNFSPPPASWRENGFDDSGWDEGPSGIGYGDEDDATEIPPCISVSLRANFTVSDPGAVDRILLHIDYDDAFVAWLNGVEIARANITSSGNPNWEQPADDDREALIYRGGMPEPFWVDDAGSLLQTGNNVLAVEMHNIGVWSSDMSFIPFFTLGMNQAPPGGGNGPADFILPLLPKLHTNFKLSAAGEILSLRSDQGGLLDQVDTGQMYADVSRGRSPDGQSTWYYFTDPTPNAPNGLGLYEDYAEAPIFSIPGGLYTGSQSIVLSAPNPDASIYWTTGGQEPDQTSTPYATPIVVTQTEVIRARAFERSCLPSLISTQSYILNDPSTLPVTSFVTDPPNLWDPETGIYVEENVWEDWERPMHVELFESDGTPQLSQDAGVKLYGGITRTYPQKSLRLISRAGYGDENFDHALFDEKPIDSFKQIVWRNSGSDWCMGHMRDGLMHRLCAHTDIDRLAYRPSRTYLNGEYWGILNIRERIDRHYLAANHDVDADNLDLIKGHWEVIEGDRVHYRSMIAFMEENDLADGANYAHVQTLMNTDLFAEYEIFQIFYSNTDWPGNNIACWRPRTPIGRWRWIIYDTDFGLGLCEPYSHNTLAFALEPDGPDWPNPPQSTFFLRKLIENEDFLHRFINRYCDHLNSSFLPSRTIAMTQTLTAVIEPEINRHMDRWEFSIWRWIIEMDIIDEFLNMRPDFARTHIGQVFGLGSSLTLSLDVSPPGAGSIQLTAVDVDSTWSGSYFQGVPISLTAIPDAGYAFLEWSDPGLPQQATIEVSPDGNYSLTAIFEDVPLPGTVVINEINYNSAADFDTGDWVELHNPGELPIDLGAWTFKDEVDTHSFIVPMGVSLPAGGFLVLCRDSTAFRALFPAAGPILGNLDFGFDGGGELLRLFDKQGLLFDSVHYDDDPPWPPEPDGLGPTLELSDPNLDNALAASWAASTGHGTPGTANSATATGFDSPSPPALVLQAPFPNPFNPHTEIHLSLDRPRQLDLVVYDISGRRVRNLASGRFEAGTHIFVWNGRNDGGRKTASGLYMLRMESEDFRSTRKLILLR